MKRTPLVPCRNQEPAAGSGPGAPSCATDGGRSASSRFLAAGTEHTPLLLAIELHRPFDLHTTTGTGEQSADGLLDSSEQFGVARERSSRREHRWVSPHGLAFGVRMAQLLLPSPSQSLAPQVGGPRMKLHALLQGSEETYPSFIPAGANRTQ